MAEFQMLDAAKRFADEDNFIEVRRIMSVLNNDELRSLVVHMLRKDKYWPEESEDDPSGRLVALLLRDTLDDVASGLLEKFSSSTNVSDISLDPVLDKCVEDMGFTVRLRNCLLAENCRYIGQVVQKREKEMLDSPNFGKKTLQELKEVLVVDGLSLGMDVGDWKSPTERE